MNARFIPCLLLLACLAACDRADGPASQAPAAPAETPAVSVPASAPAAEPAAALEPVAEPAVVTDTKKPAPALSRKTPKPQLTARSAPIEYDLHLPQELLDAIESYEPLELEPLLPAFFGREAESDIRLNGRLLESPTEDRMFDGAELKIEIRR